MKHRLLWLVSLLLLLILTGTVLAQQGTTPRGPWNGCANVVGLPSGDCNALVALYNNTMGPEWAVTTGWLQTDDPCGTMSAAWHGVTCNNGRVTKLVLSNNNLKGSIPTSIGNLTALTLLNLSDNPYISGSIPLSIGRLSLLRTLNLSNNPLAQGELTGAIPDSIGKLTNLQYLYLNGNNLTGQIPTTIGNLTRLLELSLGLNDLGGALPVELGNLKKLRQLLLHGNKFTGGLPAWLTTLPAMQVMKLSDNYFTGRIPVGFGAVSGLQHLHLDNNKLTGGIPSDIGYITNLISLYLNNNQLTGAIPGELGQLPAVQHLWLQHNLLSGAIPAQLGDLPAVQQINLSYNELRGAIPGTIFKSTLTHLLLNNNFLSGEIPVEIGNMAINLQILDLSSNGLTGPYPATLANFSALTSLDLSNNGLTGNLPDIWGNFPQLIKLNLSQNRFNGTLPASLGDLGNASGGVFVQTLDLAGNRFEGDIPSNLQNISTNIGTPKINLNFNMLTADPFNTGLQFYLDNYAPTWDLTQAIPPTITSNNFTNYVVRVDWTPIPLSTADTLNKISGHYELRCTDGTNNLQATTLNKNETFLEFYGVPLGTYTCKVNTVLRPHPGNPNRLDTEVTNTAQAFVINVGNKAPSLDNLNGYANAPDITTGANYQFSLADVTILDNAARDTRTPEPVLPASCINGFNPNTAPALYFKLPSEVARGGPGRFPTGSAMMSSGSEEHYETDEETPLSGTPIDTVMAIFTYNNGDFTFVVCNDNATPGTVGSSLVFDRDPLMDYYVVVWFKNTNGVNFTFVAGEVPMLINHQFEIDANRDNLPDRWKTNNKAGVRIRCEPTYAAYVNTGRCGVQLFGKGTRLYQDVRSLVINGDPEVPTPAWDAGDEIQLAAFIRRVKVPAVAQMRLRIYYDDPIAHPNKVITKRIPIGNSAGFNVYVTDADPLTEGAQPYVLEGTVSKVRVEFQYNATKGHLRIDDVLLNYVDDGDTIRSDSQWIPLPPAP